MGAHVLEFFLKLFLLTSQHAPVNFDLFLTFTTLLHAAFLT